MQTTKRYGERADRALGMWVKLARAYAVFNAVSRREIRTHGLTQPQFAVLESLAHIGPMTMGELTRKMLVSGGNMTCVVDNLEKDGLVARQVTADDHRSVRVALTDEGVRLIERIFPEHAEIIAAAAGVLSEQEQETLGELLRKLGKGLRQS
jgi:MarR family transcriptional regulator, 2-MHQ and catechol-resistance regulon repressor